MSREMRRIPGEFYQKITKSIDAAEPVNARVDKSAGERPLKKAPPRRCFT